MEICRKNLVHFLDNGCCPKCTHFAYIFVYFFTFLRKFLLTGFPLHPEFTILAFRTVVSKTQEIKGLQFPFPSFLSVGFCEPSELYQSALFFRQAQSKVLHSIFQSFIESFCFFLVLEAAYEIIGIVYDTTESFHFWLYLLLEPPQQHIMHVYA